MQERFAVEEVVQTQPIYGVHDKKTGVLAIPKFGTLEDAEKICRVLNLKNRIKEKI